MKRFLTGLCLVLAAVAANLAMAEQASTNRLWERLDAQAQASGRFLQELYSEEDELLERSSGRYAVLRPGFFRWEIEYPDRQLILVAGNDLWHYDIDLAAATRRDTRDNQEFTPLELLAGNSDTLTERFSVEALGGDRFRLIPTFAQAGFSAVEISWEGDALAGMQVRDRSGQTISIALSPDTDAPRLEAEDFAFTPPDGVDVYDPDGS